MKPLRIALTKGRLEKDTVALFEKIGYDCSAVREKGRKLILPVGDSMEVVLAKAPDEFLVFREDSHQPRGVQPSLPQRSDQRLSLR